MYYFTDFLHEHLNLHVPLWDLRIAVFSWSFCRGDIYICHVNDALYLYIFSFFAIEWRSGLYFATFSNFVPDSWKRTRSTTSPPPSLMSLVLSVGKCSRWLFWFCFLYSFIHFQILNKDEDPYWFKAEYNGIEGLIPSNYIRMMEHSWYLGNITRSDAESLLMKPGNTDGAFLVRMSESTPGEFSISVRYVDEFEL